VRLKQAVYRPNFVTRWRRNPVWLWNETWTSHVLLRVEKGKIFPILKQSPLHENVWGSGRIAPLNLNLGTVWRWVVSFTLRPHYPGGKWPRYPFYRMDGPQRSLDAMAKRKDSCPYRESNPGCPARSLVTILTELHELLLKVDALILIMFGVKLQGMIPISQLTNFHL
jgi:hypothetical protein